MADLLLLLDSPWQGMLNSRYFAQGFAVCRPPAERSRRKGIRPRPLAANSGLIDQLAVQT
jgi:hypothetical protein